MYFTAKRPACPPNKGFTQIILYSISTFLWWQLYAQMSGKNPRKVARIILYSLSFYVGTQVSSFSLSAKVMRSPCGGPKGPLQALGPEIEEPWVSVVKSQPYVQLKMWQDLKIDSPSYSTELEQPNKETPPKSPAVVICNEMKSGCSIH